MTTVALPAPPGVTDVVRVESAAEMADAVLGRFADVDVVVMAAAVADYAPADFSPTKLKKETAGAELVMRLKRTPDVLAAIAARKSHQMVIGFAAETDQVVDNALEKLKSEVDRGEDVDMLIRFVEHADRGIIK